MIRLVMLMMIGSLFTSAAQPRPTIEPLDVRVTIDYRDAPAVDVLGTLASAAGVPLEIDPGSLTPVTITLTNVKLRTALNAVCDNASCGWSFVSTSDRPSHVKVTPVPTGSASLPPSVSFDVYDTPARDLFRALAAALGVPVTIDPGISSEPVTMKFKNAMTAQVLNTLCELHQCEWEFDESRGLRVTRKP